MRTGADHRGRARSAGALARMGIGLFLGLALLALAGAGAAAAATRSATSATAPAALADQIRETPPTPIVSGVGSGGVLFYDGFENGISAWDRRGNPGWDTTTWIAAAGSRSAYCAGSEVAAPGPYWNNMAAWMIAGSFNLSAYGAATFGYAINFNTESNRDYVKALVSIDGSNYYGFGYSGAGSGWADDEIDLTNVPTLGDVTGRSQVWIAFVFTSDPSIVYQGAYVDEVTIVAGGGGGGESGMVLDASPLTVPYRGSVDMDVDLLDVGTGFLIPGRDIQWLYCQNDLLPREWTVGETESSSTGHYAFSLTNLVRRTYFIMYFPGDSQYTESWSNYVKVMARAKVTPPNVPSRVRAGARITCWGTIAPQHTAAQNRASHTKVAIQRYAGGRWRAVYSLFAQKYKNSGGVTKYSITLMFAPGKWRVRATHSDIDHAKSVSSWRTFSVY